MIYRALNLFMNCLYSSVAVCSNKVAFCEPTDFLKYLHRLSVIFRQFPIMLLYFLFYNLIKPNKFSVSLSFIRWAF